MTDIGTTLALVGLVVLVVGIISYSLTGSAAVTVALVVGGLLLMLFGAALPAEDPCP